MHIREMRRSDLPQVADVASNAFLNDEFFGFINPWRHEHFKDFRYRILFRARARFRTTNTLGIVMVLDDDDLETDRKTIQDAAAIGKEVIVGYVFYDRYPGKLTTTKYNNRLFNTLEAWLLRLEDNYLRYCPSIDLAVSHKNMDSLPSKFYDPWAELKKATKEHNGHWYLGSLAVSPSYQRRGVGSSLVRWGIEYTKRDPAPISLMASKVGRLMYVKCGYKIIDGIDFAPGLMPPDVLLLFDPEGQYTLPVKEGEIIEKRGIKVDIIWRHELETPSAQA